VNVPIPPYSQHLNPSVKNLRIGIAKEYMEGLTGPMLAVFQQALQWFEAEGVELVELSLPITPYALPTYYIIACAEASSNLARYDGVRYGIRTPAKTLDEMYMNTRHDGFGAEAKRRIMIGTYVLSAGYYDAYYTKAQKVQHLIREDFRAAFEQVDLILTPTTVGPAFGIGEKNDDPVAMYLNDVYTVPVNLAGLPAISVPAGLTPDSGLPLGVQLIGPKFSEQQLLNVGLFIQQHAGFYTFDQQGGK
jgi:aspartyl-tRNA(Asn)/glutamyl-tRNA(Gln) amidotransferase subunit A